MSDMFNAVTIVHCIPLTKLDTLSNIHKNPVYPSVKVLTLGFVFDRYIKKGKIFNTGHFMTDEIIGNSSCKLISMFEVKKKQVFVFLQNIKQTVS